MSETKREVALHDVLETHLPYLRRYARALTGTQSSGDAYASATLEAIVNDREILESGLPGGVALFKLFHSIWVSTGAPIADPGNRLEAAAARHMRNLTANTREALLLHTVEGFSFADVARIMEIDGGEAELLVEIARQEMADSVAGSVLIIEDEAIIAMDLQAIVSDMGHRIAGVARTRKEAVKLGITARPDLILADVNLADNSSGIDAVNELLAELGDLPVIFITAYPERLLTGEHPEPAFLISKPYSEGTVQSAVSQAMFFSSTETLKV
ncbi:MAG: response regulator [Rhodobacteraceae bacterium]|nr:response regulator [Paracoccaceae bacterium]